MAPVRPPSRYRRTSRPDRRRRTWSVRRPCPELGRATRRVSASARQIAPREPHLAHLSFSGFAPCGRPFGACCIRRRAWLRWSRSIPFWPDIVDVRPPRARAEVDAVDQQSLLAAQQVEVEFRHRLRRGPSRRSSAGGPRRCRSARPAGCRSGPSRSTTMSGSLCRRGTEVDRALERRVEQAGCGLPPCRSASPPGSVRRRTGRGCRSSRCGRCRAARPSAG